MDATHVLRRDTMESLLAPRSWKGTRTLSLSLYGRNSWLHSVSSRRVDFHRSCTVPFWVSTVAIHDTPDLPVYTLYVPSPSLGVLSKLQSLCMVLLTLAPLAQCTHCHFVMQARAQRVPVLCDDHTPPSCLVAYPLAKLSHRSLNILVLPDPWLTQGGLVTFPACALCQLFFRSGDLAHHGLHCSHVCVSTHHSPLQHLPFRCLPLLSSRAHMDEPQCMRVSLGTTGCNRS